MVGVPPNIHRGHLDLAISGIGAGLPGIVGRRLRVFSVDSGISARLPAILGAHLDCLVSGVPPDILGRHFDFGIFGIVARLFDILGGRRITPRGVGCGRVHRPLIHYVVFVSYPSEDGVVLATGVVLALGAVVALRIVPSSWVVTALGIIPAFGTVAALGIVFPLGDEARVVLATGIVSALGTVATLGFVSTFHEALLLLRGAVTVLLFIVVL